MQRSHARQLLTTITNFIVRGGKPAIQLITFSLVTIQTQAQEMLENIDVTQENVTPTTLTGSRLGDAIFVGVASTVISVTGILLLRRNKARKNELRWAERTLELLNEETDKNILKIMEKEDGTYYNVTNAGQEHSFKVRDKNKEYLYENIDALLKKIMSVLNEQKRQQKGNKFKKPEEAKISTLDEALSETDPSKRAKLIANEITNLFKKNICHETLELACHEYEKSHASLKTSTDDDYALLATVRLSPLVASTDKAMECPFSHLVDVLSTLSQLKIFNKKRHKLIWHVWILMADELLRQDNISFTLLKKSAIALNIILSNYQDYQNKSNFANYLLQLIYTKMLEYPSIGLCDYAIETYSTLQKRNKELTDTKPNAHFALFVQYRIDSLIAQRKILEALPYKAQDPIHHMHDIINLAHEISSNTQINNHHKLKYFSVVTHLSRFLQNQKLMDQLDQIKKTTKEIPSTRESKSQSIQIPSEEEALFNVLVKAGDEKIADKKKRNRETLKLFPQQMFNSLKEITDLEEKHQKTFEYIEAIEASELPIVKKVEFFQLAITFLRSTICKADVLLKYYKKLRDYAEKAGDLSVMRLTSCECHILYNAVGIKEKQDNARLDIHFLLEIVCLDKNLSNEVLYHRFMEIWNDFNLISNPNKTDIKILEYCIKKFSPLLQSFGPEIMDEFNQYSKLISRRAAGQLDGSEEKKRTDDIAIRLLIQNEVSTIPSFKQLNYVTLSDKFVATRRFYELLFFFASVLLNKSNEFDKHLESLKTLVNAGLTMGEIQIECGYSVDFEFLNSIFKCDPNEWVRIINSLFNVIDRGLSKVKPQETTHYLSENFKKINSLRICGQLLKDEKDDVATQNYARSLFWKALVTDERADKVKYFILTLSPMSKIREFNKERILLLSQLLVSLSEALDREPTLISDHLENGLAFCAEIKSDEFASLWSAVNFLIKGMITENAAGPDFWTTAREFYEEAERSINGNSTIYRDQLNSLKSIIEKRLENARSHPLDNVPVKGYFTIGKETLQTIVLKAKIYFYESLSKKPDPSKINQAISVELLQTYFSLWEITKNIEYLKTVIQLGSVRGSPSYYIFVARSYFAMGQNHPAPQERMKTFRLALTFYKSIHKSVLTKKDQAQIKECLEYLVDCERKRRSEVKAILNQYNYFFSEELVYSPSDINIGMDDSFKDELKEYIARNFEMALLSKRLKIFMSDLEKKYKDVIHSEELHKALVLLHREFKSRNNESKSSLVISQSTLDEVERKNSNTTILFQIEDILRACGLKIKDAALSGDSPLKEKLAILQRRLEAMHRNSKDLNETSLDTLKKDGEALIESMKNLSTSSDELKVSPQKLKKFDIEQLLIQNRIEAEAKKQERLDKKRAKKIERPRVKRQATESKAEVKTSSTGSTLNSLQRAPAKPRIQLAACAKNHAFAIAKILHTDISTESKGHIALGELVKYLALQHHLQLCFLAIVMHMQNIERGEEEEIKLAKSMRHSIRHYGMEASKKALFDTAVQMKDILPHYLDKLTSYGTTHCLIPDKEREALKEALGTSSIFPLLLDNTPLYNEIAAISFSADLIHDEKETEDQAYYRWVINKIIPQINLLSSPNIKAPLAKLNLFRMDALRKLLEIASELCNVDRKDRLHSDGYFENELKCFDGLGKFSRVSDARAYKADALAFFDELGKFRGVIGHQFPDVRDARINELCRLAKNVNPVEAGLGDLAISFNIRARASEKLALDECKSEEFESKPVSRYRRSAA